MDLQSAHCTKYSPNFGNIIKSHALLDMISTGPDLEEAAAQPSVSISVKPNDQISVAEAFDSW